MAMTITGAAANVIREWLRASADVSHPVIYLGQTSNSPPEVDQAIKRGVRGKELENIARRTLKSERRYLYPLVYPRSRFLWLATSIGGFRFASRLFYPRPIRRALKNGVLDAVERGLVLKDSDGTVLLPASASDAP